MLKRVTLFSTLGLSLVLLTSAYLSDTGRAGKTGSPGETTCISCHGDFTANSGGGTIALNGITGGSYTPGTTYNLSVTVSRTGSTVFGLGCEALTTANTNAGSFIITNSAETHILSATVSGSSRSSVTHQLDGGASNNTHTFSFDWTAPAAGTGDVTLYYAGIAGNYDGGEGGDYVYDGSLTLTEAGGCTTPAQPGAISGSVSSCSGQSQTYSVAAVTGATSYAWTIPSGWTGTSSTNSITTTAGSSSGSISVVAVNACGNSPATTLAVTSSTGVTPSVSIASNASGSICSGTSVTFTASPTNGGSAPSYQWKVNGTNAGSNSNSFTSSALANGDVISCVLTSNAACVTSATANSNSVTISVSNSVTPAVVIASSASGSICSGTSVTFTATPTNGGSTPSYQWQVNGTNTGSNNPTFTSASLTNGDVVTCVMTSSAACASSSTSNSNSVTMSVSNSVTPTVVIASSASGSICSGTSVTFTATPSSGGSSPSYQWQVNGANVGSNSTSFTSSTLANGDVVTCVMTSNSTCVSSNTATSNSINMNVSNSVAPTVSISSNAGGNICSGSSVTFTALATNGGASPSYQWDVNGSVVGSNSPTFTTTTLANGDQVSCTLTSNSACASTPTANSNVITINVSSSFTASVSAGGPTTFCAGGQVTLTASAGDSYLWSPGGETTASIDVITSGSYAVTVTSGTCSATAAPVDVVVDNGPAVSLAAVSSLCSTDSAITLSGGSPAGGDYAINGTSATTFDPSASGIGTFVLSYSVSGTNGCSGSASTNITVSDCNTTPGDCDDFTAYSQKEWGTAGSVADDYLNAHFSTAFPQGITIGNCGNTLALTTAAAVADFLPSNGWPRPLRQGAMIDPGTSYLNSLAGEIVALTLNITFDSLDTSFGASGELVANAIVTQGPYQGWSVRDVLDEANQVIGCSAGFYRYFILYQTLHQINQPNMVASDDDEHDHDGEHDGDDDGEHWGGHHDPQFVVCASNYRQVRIAHDIFSFNEFSLSVSPNPSNGWIRVHYTIDQNIAPEIKIVDMMGREVYQQLLPMAEAGSYQQDVYLDDATIKNGIYFLRLINGTSSLETKLMLFR